MRKTLLCTSISLLALLFAFDLSAKTSINYSADQAAACPPTTAADSVDDGAANEQPAATSTPSRPTPAPIKSSKNNRPKWKALLPGAIR
jgi:hypothetical protein